MLRSFITDEEKCLMRDYINEYSGSYSCADIDYLLREWANKKQTMYKLLGDQMMVHNRFEYQASDDELYDRWSGMFGNEFSNYRYNKNSPWRRDPASNSLFDFCLSVNEVLTKAKYTYKWFDAFGDGEEHITEEYGLGDIFCSDYMISNRWEGNEFTIQSPKHEQPIKFQSGAKFSKMVHRLVKEFDLDENGYEEFRLLQSRITNEKTITGDLTISIHPFDFMTMSHNNCDWTTCMNWPDGYTNEGGEYRQGTLSMMNSPMIVVAYLNADTEFRPLYEFDDERIWTNKKWRQLFIVDDRAIIGIKSYPYWNPHLTEAVAQKLRSLAEENLGWTYDGEIKEWKYRDELGVIVRVGDRSAMYCDMGCQPHHIIYNSVYLTDDTIIEYGGIGLCLECGDLCWPDSFDGEDKLLCRSCYPYIKCCECGEEVHKDDAYENEVGDLFCSHCYAEYHEQCTICSKGGLINDGNSYIDLKHNSFYANSAYICSDCRKQANAGKLSNYFYSPTDFTIEYNWREQAIESDQLTDEGLEDLFSTNREDLDKHYPAE